MTLDAKPQAEESVTAALEVLYEDNHCLAVSKPSGIASAHFQGEQATLDHLSHELRHDEHLALWIVGQVLMQVLDDVRQDIQTDEVERAKRRGLWPAGRRAGDLIHFLNRIAVVEHRANRDQRAERADAIGDKVGPILRDDHAFAQALIEKAKHRA